MDSRKEQILDEKGWRIEAEAIIKDVQCGVNKIIISEVLQSDIEKIYLNITLKEMLVICVELSGRGFQIVGKRADSKDEPSGTHYETPYSLLNSVSPLFSKSFGMQLQEKLNKLAMEQNNESD